MTAPEPTPAVPKAWRDSWHLAVLAALALAAWQALPDRYMGPWQAWNPHAIMEFVITIFSISIAGRLLTRWIGPRYGVLLTGFIGGFASSTATMHTLGVMALRQPVLAHRAAIAALLSNMATLLQLLLIVRVLAPGLLAPLLLPACMGLLGIALYGAWMLRREPRISGTGMRSGQGEPVVEWKALLSLTALVCLISWAAAGLNAWLGHSGLYLGAALAGLADAHAFVPSVASMIEHGQLSLAQAPAPLLVALAANTAVKGLIAWRFGGSDYALRVGAGLLMAGACVWLGTRL